MGGHAADGAGSLADRCLVAMTGSRNYLSVAVAAALASVSLRAVFGAGCRHHSLLIVMTQSCYGVAGIAVAANRAGIGGIAGLGAGGLGNGRGIAVTGCRNRFGIAVAALGAGIGDAAILSAGGCGLSSLFIAVLMVGFHGHHILGTGYHIGGGSGCDTGKGKPGIGLSAVPNGTGGSSTGKGCTVIAAPCDLGQLPPVVPCRGNRHLDVPEALHVLRHRIGLGHRSTSAAGIGTDGGPGSAIGGNLNICISAVVAMGRSRDLNCVKPNFCAQIHTGIHAGGLAAGGPVIGRGIAVNEVGCHAVIAAVGIAGNGSRCGSGIGYRSAGALNIVEVCLCNGRVTGMGNGLLTLQSVNVGGLPNFQRNILSGQLLRIGIAAAGAGIDGVAIVILGSMVMSQRRNGLGIAFTAVGAGIGNTARLGAGSRHGGRNLILMYLRRRIGVEGTVCIKAASYHGLIQVRGVAVVHGKTHCPQRQTNLLCLLGFRLSAGVIAPHAEHTADYRSVADSCAADLIIVPVGGIGIASVKIIALPQHIVEIAGSVDDFEAIADQICYRAGTIAVPAVRPVAHNDVPIKGIGNRTNRGAGFYLQILYHR